MKYVKGAAELFCWLLGYVLVIVAGIAVMIALGYLLGCIISVREASDSTTGGVCTSTLCQ